MINENKSESEVSLLILLDLGDESTLRQVVSPVETPVFLRSGETSRPCTSRIDVILDGIAGSIVPVSRVGGPLSMLEVGLIINLLLLHLHLPH